MSTINFSGLVSGLDTASIISALVDAAREPINKLETKKANYNSQLSVLSDLNSRLSSLRSAAQSLDTLSEFRSNTAESSDSDKVAAVASSTAIPGTYAINIASLAWSERTYSNQLTDKDELNQVGNGTLRIRVGSTAEWTTIEVDQSIDTLEEVAQHINDANAGVTATVVEQSDTEYRLMIVGNEPGTDNDIEFEETGNLDTVLGFTVNTPAQLAADAHIIMDGKDFYRGSNQVTDVIPGVTLNLKDTTNPSTVNISVAMDPDAIVNKISSFISSYNSVISVIQQQSTYTGEARMDRLIGDSTIRNIKLQLQHIITSQIDGVTGEYKALSQVGIKTNKDGTLTMDTTEMKEALADDLSSVTSLFTYNDNNASLETDGIALRLVHSIDAMLRNPDGLLTGRTRGINDSISSIDDRIASMERYVSSYEEGLRRQYTALETLMSNIQNQGSYLSASLGG